MPCQCTVVGAGRSLTSLALTTPPAVASMRGPGSDSPYAQVETVRRPSETDAGRARNVTPRDGRAALLPMPPAPWTPWTPPTPPVAAPAAAGVAPRAANMPVTNNLRETGPRARAEPFTTDPPIHLAR